MGTCYTFEQSSQLSLADCLTVLTNFREVIQYCMPYYVSTEDCVQTELLHNLLFVQVVRQNVVLRSKRYEIHKNTSNNLLYCVTRERGYLDVAIMQLKACSDRMNARQDGNSITEVSVFELEHNTSTHS